MPLLVAGDALQVLQRFPADTFDCCMTSPPYWGKREHSGGGIGLERYHLDFVANVCTVCSEIRRVLKPTGSLWLNIGDSMHFHAYRFGEREGKYIIELALRLSTDAEGVAACLGLKAEPKVEFDRIVMEVEKKLSPETLVTI